MRGTNSGEKGLEDKFWRGKDLSGIKCWRKDVVGKIIGEQTGGEKTSGERTSHRLRLTTGFLELNCVVTRIQSVYQ